MTALKYWREALIVLLVVNAVFTHYQIQQSQKGLSKEQISAWLQANTERSVDNEIRSTINADSIETLQDGVLRNRFR